MDPRTEQQAHAVEMSQDWQIGKTSVVERARHLLNSGLYADCEFLVGANGSEQEVIKANKTFLGMSSPVFDKMFSGNMAEGAVTNQPIAIPDLTPSAFKDLLMYMYSDSLNLQSMDQALSLWQAAQKYILPHLVAKCIQYVKIKLSPEHNIRVLEFIKVFEDETIKVKCLSLLRERTLECLASSDFEDAQESTVLAIVKEEVLNIREVELFDVVIRWAKRQCAQHELEINGSNLRQELKEILHDIRFLTMKSEEFSSSPVLSGMLTENECLAIYQNINNPDSNWPIPIDLSSSRKPRKSSLESGPTEIRCLRQFENRAITLLKPSDNLEVSLIVDKDVMITGIIIAPLYNPHQFSHQVFQLDCKLYQTTETSTFLVASVIISKSSPPHSFTFNPINFDLPVELKRDKKYLIRVAVSQQACFELGRASNEVSCQGVCFKFASDDVARNGVVRGVTFYPC